MKRNEDGTITAFVVIFMVALLLMGGLVIDGGFLLASRRRAFDEADAAARAGAQALADRNSGRLDPVVADRLARTYLTRTGHEGSVNVSGDTITVDVEFVHPVTILGMSGLGDITVRGRGRASGLQGVVEEGDLQ